MARTGCCAGTRIGASFGYGRSVRLRQGYDALASGDWALAERLFDEAVRERATADGLDGLGRAR